MNIELAKQSISETIWLNYFNRTLYEKGIISESEHNRMTALIANRKPPNGKKTKLTPY